MPETVIKVENLYKEYKLGVINHGTLTHDLQSWWARIRGKDDPNSLISEQHNIDAETNSFLALKDINFEVKAGERLGIIGKNGAGKSTLLKILSKITSPTRGNVKIKGRVGSLLEVGTGFHPELTGRENIYLNGAILGMSRKEIDRKLDEIVDFSGIEKHLDTPVKRYSSGMNVRLGFAVAAHLEPEILIVDEVLAVGDAEFQKKAIGKMEDVSKGEGRTILFVSHNMAAVKGLCANCFLLKSGTIVSYGDTNRIVAEYHNMNNLNKVEENFSKENNYPKKDRFQLLSIKIDNSNGNNNICCGGTALFNIKFEIFSEKYDNLRFGISFHDAESGNYITELNSYYLINDNICLSKGMYNAVFKINKIPFSPGLYSINLIVTTGLEILDWQKGCYQIAITDGLFYKTSRMPALGSYPIFFSEFEFDVKKFNEGS